jgi:hypothetical protein
MIETPRSAIGIADSVQDADPTAMNRSNLLDTVAALGVTATLEGVGVTELLWLWERLTSGRRADCANCAGRLLFSCHEIILG